MGRTRIYANNAERQRAFQRRQRTELRALRSAAGQYPRHEWDLYVTPVEVIEAVLAMVTVEPDRVLDVGANDGRWGAAAQARWPLAQVSGVELRPVERPAGFARWYTGDFLEGAKWLSPYDLIIGNPPYALAEAFIRAAIGLLWDGGEVCFLLQSQFLHSKGRRDGLFREYPLRRIYPLAGRVSYHSGRGGTRDATAFLWQQGYEGPEEMFRGRY
jgi:hypothetical protein